jgi:hypothetical protein
MTTLPSVHKPIKLVGILAQAAHAEHARLSPSSAKKWLSCAGSLVLEAPFPDTPSEHSDRGTCCHIVAAECLISQELHPSDWLMDRVKVSRPGEPDRFVEFTEDLCTMTTDYVEAIKALTKDRELFVEKKVEFSMYVDIADQFGTIDAHWLEPLGTDQSDRPETYQICICDLKTGYKFVATDSPQLKIYALAVLALYDLSHDVESVRLMIFQPRHGGMREEVISVADLRAFALELKDGAQKAKFAAERYAACAPLGGHQLESWYSTYLNPNPNEEDCAFCKAMAICPAARAKLEETVGADFDVIDENADTGSLIDHVVVDVDDAPVSENLGKLMAITGFLEDWIKSVRAEVERRLMLGEPVAGYGLELGRQGARAWSDEAEAERMVREQFRVKAENAYSMKLKSPTQLEKLATAAKATKKNPNPEKPVITARQWEKLQPLIKRSDPVPSVRPLSQIKELWKPTQADDAAFDVIDENTDLY